MPSYESLVEQLFSTPPPVPAKITLIVRKLYDSGDLNRQDQDGNTCLMNAVLQGNLSVIQALEKMRASETVYNKEGLTALMLAIITKQKDIVSHLSHSKQRDQYRWGVSEQQYYRKPYDYDDEYFINRLSKDGKTPLMFAVETGDIEVVNALLVPLEYKDEHGDREQEKRNFQNKKGETALMLAAKGNNLQILDRVFRIEDLNIKNKKKQTALDCALEANQGQNAIFLISQGADIKNNLDKCKDLMMNSVDLCMIQGRVKQAKKLLKKCILFYPELAQQAIYRLAQDAYNKENTEKEPLGFEEGKSIPLCVKYALKLDSSKLTPDQKEFKNKIIKEYWFSDKLDDKLFSSNILPMVEQSHQNPVLVYAAIERYKNGLPANQVQNKPVSKGLNDTQKELMSKILEWPSQPNWFQRMWQKLFPKPSDLQLLQSELTKKPNKQKQEIIVAIIRRILLKGESLPADAIKKNPDVIIAALQTIIKEKPLDMKQNIGLVKNDWDGDDVEYDFYDLADVRHLGSLKLGDQRWETAKVLEAFLAKHVLEDGWPLNNEALLLKAHEILGQYYLEQCTTVATVGDEPQMHSKLAAAILQVQPHFSSMPEPSLLNLSPLPPSVVSEPDVKMAVPVVSGDTVGGQEKLGQEKLQTDAGATAGAAGPVDNKVHNVTKLREFFENWSKPSAGSKESESTPKKPQKPFQKK